MYLPSDIISLNHRPIEYKTAIKAKKKKLYAEENACIVNTPVVVRESKFIPVQTGQGEGDTKWKGWAWKLLLVRFDIINYIYFYITNYIRVLHIKYGINSIRINKGSIGKG